MAEQRLWAPWRMQYVQGERGEPGCIFCLAAEPGDDEARYVLQRGEGCFAMLNAFPYNSGHLMVAPDRHVASLADLGDDESLALMRLLQRSLGAIRAAYRPDGLNIGVNEGKVAGAGFAGRARARRPALGGRQQLHGGNGGHAGAAAVARGHVRRAAPSVQRLTGAGAVDKPRAHAAITRAHSAPAPSRTSL
jgi:ATP adenylyltransferase